MFQTVQKRTSVTITEPYGSGESSSPSSFSSTEYSELYGSEAGTLSRFSSSPRELGAPREDTGSPS
jgi:hypothetical protein